MSGMVNKRRRRRSIVLGLLIIGASFALGIWWLNGPDGEELCGRLRSRPPQASVFRKGVTSDIAASNRTFFDSITDGAREGVRAAVHEQLGPTLHGLGNAIQDTLRGHGTQLEQALEPAKMEPSVEEERRRLDEEKRQW